MPSLKNCKELFCEDNQLTNLPELRKCQFLYCRNNQLPYQNFVDFKKFWKFKRFYLQLKYFRQLYKKMLLLKAKRKHDLHLELKYSPNLSFYKQDEYYKHFTENQSNVYF